MAYYPYRILATRVTAYYKLVLALNPYQLCTINLLKQALNLSFLFPLLACF